MIAYIYDYVYNIYINDCSEYLLKTLLTCSSHFGHPLLIVFVFAIMMNYFIKILSTWKIIFLKLITQIRKYLGNSQQRKHNL